MSPSAPQPPLWASRLHELPGYVGASPFYRLLGFEIDVLEPGHAVLRMPAQADLYQFQSAVHGGAIFSVADAAVAVALLTLCRVGDAVLTVEAKLNYLAPITQGDTVAEATIVKNGRSFALGEVRVSRSDGKLAAMGLMTYTVRGPAQDGAL